MVHRPEVFRVMVAVDLKFVPDIVGTMHTFLNIFLVHGYKVLADGDVAAQGLFSLWPWR